MIEVPNIPPMRPEPERNRWGQYVLPDTSGRKRGWTRATTLAKTLSDETALTKWKQRTMMQGLVRRRDLLDLVGPIEAELEHPDPDERRSAKDALQALCDDAVDAGGGNRGSGLGTALHSITEYADCGRLNEIQHLVPQELMDDLAAYLRTMKDEGIERPPEWVERIIVNPMVDSAGTIDRIVRAPGYALPLIADLKTAKTLDFGWLEIAIQLAEYANAPHLWDEEVGELVAMPEVNKEIALVFHLPVGSALCTIYEVDLVAGWKAAQLAHEVKLARKQAKSLARLYSAPWPEPPARPEPGADDHVLFLIRAAVHPDSLTGIWRDHVTKGLPWTAELNQAAIERKAQLIAAAENAPASDAA